MPGSMVPMLLDSGATVYVQAVDEDTGFTQLGRGDTEELAENLRFEQALDAVKPAVEQLFRAFKALNEPDEIGLEVGLTLSGKLRAFVITGDSQASLKLSLKWQRE